MLKSINKFFDNFLKVKTEEAEESSTDKIHLACATLMIELCKADQEIDDSETKALVEILRNKYSLEQEALDELMLLAEAEAKEATSLFQFTSLINDEYTYQDKTRLLQNMWEVAFADGKLDRYEEHLIRKVADLLYLNHSDFIRTKRAAAELS